MDRWESRGGKSQRREEREEERRSEKRKSEKKEDEKVREKVRKSRSTVFFQWVVAPEGGKVGSLKRRVQSHVAR